MSLSFYRVPLVEENQPLRSRDVAAMARALKKIDLSGVGNTVWRRVMWAYNAFRQLRNSDASGLVWPPQGEFFEIYQHLDPENDPAKIEAAPGEFEGLNLASIMPGFVFGGQNFTAEQFRMGDGLVPLWFGNRPASTPEEWWEVAKAQRGVVDPREGVQNVPALEAAASAHISAGGNIVNPHGKSWGGVFPFPTEISNCGNSAEDSTIPNFEIFFTALNDEVSTAGYHGTISTNGDGRKVITYAGSCPYFTEFVADGHVQAIIQAAKAYYVFIYLGGTFVVDVFPLADWLEGPYSGNAGLWRYDGGHISHALWAFVKDFRGTEAQRNPDTFDVQKLAFDFQRFFENQYHLAPNIGTFNGANEIQANYPTATIKGTAGQTISAGTFLPFVGSGKKGTHDYADGFVLSGYMAKASNISAPVTLEILNDEKIIGRVTLQPDGPAVVKYLTAIHPEPLRVRVVSKVKFKASGQITFEANEIAEYKPDHFDAYMLLRLAATRGGFQGEGRFLDGSGVDDTGAKAIFDGYAQYGCVVNTSAAGVRSNENSLSENPVYDAMRRLTRHFSRIVNRRNFLSYEVSGGKAILRFKRWAYGLNNQKADYFKFIAPDWRPVSEVIEGEEYVVRSHTGGSITYGGRKLGHNKRLIGQRGVSEFEIDGDAVLLVYDGIKSVARRKGWTNEWCMFMNFHHYHPSDTSLWKTDAYGDYFTWNNRAHIYSQDAPTRLRRLATIFQANYPAAWSSPEVPDAYNYYGGANAGADADFCSSNPIFKAPYDIESATVEFSQNEENDVVKLVFKSRFQTHPDAPASIDIDPETWSGGELSGLAAEDYRTDDNALRQYCALDRLGVHSTWKKGDDAVTSDLQILPDNPFACCIPHFFFAKLPEEPYADGNNKLDDHDSRVVIDNFMWWEIWLKSGCEGFVDGLTTAAFVCENAFGQPYDYLFENLINEANGKRIIGDFQTGHGPMVNTKPLASLYNEFARCINLLNKVQIHNLLEFQVRTLTYEGSASASAGWIGTGGVNCPPGASGAFWLDGCPPAASLVSTSVWAAATGVSGSASGTAGQCGPGGSAVGTFSTRTQDEFRYAPLTNLENAIPDDIKDLIGAGHLSVWGTVTRSKSSSSKEITTDTSLTGCFTGNGAFNIDSETGYIFVESQSEESETCVELNHGFSTQVNAPCGTFAACSQIVDGDVVQGLKAGSVANITFLKKSDDSSAVCTIPLVDQEVES